MDFMDFVSDLELSRGNKWVDGELSIVRMIEVGGMGKPLRLG
jgi:hypothetical protein